ncbi:multicopper oxidase [Gammaproteobacteria bacterium]|nr:multicopper oxidase [Gammaproteobacteria bacterium]
MKKNNDLQSANFKRRTFLKGAALSAAAIITGKSFAQMHDMHNMDHGSMDHGDGNATAQADTKKMRMIDGQLFPEAKFPQDQALPALNSLKNQSTVSGQFVAHLQAKPASVELVPDLKTIFWAYNGQVPGPLIEVYEGDTLTITFQNDLPQASTIHWHGLPVPPDQDGNPQDEVKSGQSRVYTFTLPQGCAGTYWYHPHGHETVAEQAFRGLAGALIVRAKQDPLAHIPEQNWLISDLKLDEQGQIADNTMIDWMNGREGQFVLINGAYKPQINLDQATRVRVWNACSGRYLKLALADATVYLIGTDGGLLEEIVEIEDLLLTPGERAQLLIIPKKTGSVYLQSLAYDRGKMGPVGVEPTRNLAKVNLKLSTMPTIPTKLRDLPKYANAKSIKKLEYTETMEMGSGMNFFINGKQHDMARVDLTSKVGELEEWIIFNNSHMDHNFHIHGEQFKVIDFELNGKLSVPIAALKDTVNLKPYETVRLHILQTHKGLRMYHCHILEHETLGMMGQLEVI